MKEIGRSNVFGQHGRMLYVTGINPASVKILAFELHFWDLDDDVEMKCNSFL